LSQFKKHHPSKNLKFNNLGIFQSLKLCILIILPISLKLNFAPNTLGCYGLIEPGVFSFQAAFLGERNLRDCDFTTRVLDCMFFTGFVSERGQPWRPCDVWDDLYNNIGEQLRLEAQDPRLQLTHIQVSELCWYSQRPHADSCFPAAVIFSSQGSFHNWDSHSLVRSNVVCHLSLKCYERLERNLKLVVWFPGIGETALHQRKPEPSAVRSENPKTSWRGVRPNSPAGPPSNRSRTSPSNNWWWLIKDKQSRIKVNLSALCAKSILFTGTLYYFSPSGWRPSNHNNQE